MDFRRMQYILAICQAGSISGAAKDLFISQPALSQTLRQIEAELGAQIFYRNISPLRLTTAGQRYLEYMRQVIAAQTNLHNEIQDLCNGNHGQLRLGIAKWRSRTLIPNVISDFVQKYPHVYLSLYEKSSKELERMVVDGMVDVAFLTTVPSYKDLEYTLIEHNRALLIASKRTQLARSYPSGTQLPIRYAQYENFIVLTPGYNFRSFQDRLFAREKIAPRILLETDEVATALQLTIKCNAAFVIAHCFLRATEYNSSDIAIYPLETEEEIPHFYICYRRGLYFPRYLLNLLDMIKHYFAALDAAV